MAVVNGYCTTQDVRDHLGDPDTKLTTALLEKAINAASRAIDRHCGRRFWQDSSTVERTYIVGHPSYAFVDDISTRTGVVVKTGTDGATFPTTLTVGTDYILEPRNADKFASATFGAYAFWQVRLVGSQTFVTDSTRATLAVTARYGWSAVPDDVVEACILKAASLFKRKDAPFGVAGFGEFGAVRIARSDIDVVSLLEQYQLPGFA